MGRNKKGTWANRKPKSKTQSKLDGFVKSTSGIDTSFVHDLFTNEKAAIIIVPLEELVKTIFPKLTLLQLAQAKIPTRQDGKQLPTFNVLIFNSISLFHTTKGDNELQGITNKMIKLLKTTFYKSPEDSKDIQKLKDYDRETPRFFFLVICSKPSSDRFTYSNLEVISCLTGITDFRDGTVLSWMATDTRNLMTEEYVSKEIADNRSFSRRGLGTFLIVLLQSCLKLDEGKGWNQTIWAQVNTDSEISKTPSEWYRKELFFVPVLDVSRRPDIVKRHYIEDATLCLFHSTISIRQGHGLDLQLSAESDIGQILDHVGKVLHSYDMPERVKRPKNTLPPKVLELKKDMKRKVDHSGVRPGVDYADGLRSSPTESTPVIHADEETLENVWAVYVHESGMSEQAKFIRAVDNESGNFPGIVEEKSCLYVCLSKEIYGSTKYYWRLRLVVALAHIAFSKLPSDHYLMKEGSMFREQFEDGYGSIDPNVYSGGDREGAYIEAFDGFHSDTEDENPEHRELQQQFRYYAKLILLGDLDAGMVEQVILNHFFDMVINTISARTGEDKPRNASNDCCGRRWQLNIMEASSAYTLYPGSYEQHPQNNVVLGHIENQHYVTVSWHSEPPSTSVVMESRIQQGSVGNNGSLDVSENMEAIDVNDEFLSAQEVDDASDDLQEASKASDDLQDDNDASDDQQEANIALTNPQGDNKGSDEPREPNDPSGLQDYNEAPDDPREANDVSDPQDDNEGSDDPREPTEAADESRVAHEDSDDASGENDYWGDKIRIRLELLEAAEMMVATAPDHLREELEKESNSKESQDLYKFEESQQSFKEAKAYYKKRIIQPTKVALDRKRAKLDPNHREGTRKKEEQVRKPSKVALDRKKAKLDQKLREGARKKQEQVRKGQYEGPKFYSVEVDDLQKRVDADRYNMNIESSLHTKDATKHLHYNGKEWMASVELGTLGKELVHVEVDEHWVKSNFHQKFVKFIKHHGKTEGFNELSMNSWFYVAGDESIRYQIDGIMFRHYYHEKPSKEDATFLLYKGNLEQRKTTRVSDHEWFEGVLRNNGLLHEYELLVKRAQHIANAPGNCPCYDYHSRVPLPCQPGCFRFVKMDIPEEKQFTTCLDRRQVRAIRWNQQLRTWQGLCTTMVNSKPKDSAIPLVEEWVAKNFPADIDEWKEQGQSLPHRRIWFKVPVGSPRFSSVVPHELIREGAPKIHYLQGKGNTCVPDSMANALYFIEKFDLAEKVHKAGLEWTSNGLEKDAEIVSKTREFIRKNGGKRLTPHKLKHNSHNLLDQDHITRDPRMVVLLAEDGDASHAVTIVDKWIFDSGFATALPLCQESFDLICGGDDTRMVGFISGYWFHPHLAAKTPVRQKKK